MILLAKKELELTVDAYEKQRAEERDQILKNIRKEFGDQSMFLMGKSEKLSSITVRSSGSLQLDLALGGGYAHGRIVELFGGEAAGKTTVLSLAIAEAQRSEPDKENAIIDLEHTYEPAWARKLGVNVDNLFLTQPDTYAEKIFEMLEFMLRSGKYAIIGLDSVAGLILKAEFESGDYEKEGRVGGGSKLNTQAMRKIVNSGLLTESGTSLIFINQLRDKIGGFSPFGTPTTTPGGRALKHAYTHQLDLRKGELFTKGQGKEAVTLGNQIEIRVSKNKIAAPFKRATLDLYYEHGMDRVMEVVNVAKEIGVLSGTSWLKPVNLVTGEAISGRNGEEVKWNGVPKTREAMVVDIEENEGFVFNQIFNAVNELLRGA